MVSTEKVVICSRLPLQKASEAGRFDLLINTIICLCCAKWRVVICSRLPIANYCYRRAGSIRRSGVSLTY